MRNLVDLRSLHKEDIFEIFHIADKIREGEFKDFLKGKSIVLFFPDTSIRTRVTFEKGIYLLGGQSILFPTETLDKKEKLEDVCEYLNNWADENAILNPCPPFYCGEEVDEDVIDSDYFVGYQFKKSLVEVQQAITIYCFMK